jgi:hypothetical protein
LQFARALPRPLVEGQETAASLLIRVCQIPARASVSALPMVANRIKKSDLFSPRAPIDVVRRVSVFFRNLR